MTHSSLGELQLSADEMRKLGYRVIDAMVQHFSELPDKPAMRVSPHSVLEPQLREPLPLEGAPVDEVLSTVTDRIFGSIGHLNHPRFFGFIPTPGNFVSAMADALTAAYTPFCGTWLEGSGPAEVELMVIDWIRGVFGMPAEAGGLLVSGGSVANLTALAAARHARSDVDARRHMFYCSDQTHSSIDRAIRILGYEPTQLRHIPSDDQFRLPVDRLRAVIEDDRKSGLYPLVVIANAGATNTGAVDPLADIGAFCREEWIWMHVDGAYGGAAMFSDRQRGSLAGIEGAQSVTLDPHKWLFQPFACGCVLVEDRAILRDTFEVLPEYLQDTRTGGREINFCDYGVELTRPFRALKLWMSFKAFGAGAFGRAIDHGIRMAEFAESVLRQSSAWEITSTAQMGIVSFRYNGATDEQIVEIGKQVAEDGCCFASTTVLRGRTVFRLCTINPSTTEDDIRQSVECLEKYGRMIVAR